ncbi:MarR family winged helix-turn-helix transcriptional regulator [Dietzia alimentaria]|uniref:MarR family winged helix-turn-helix transcriptional regulator n=1 Tax=Dietzia alimentaria TaxID=665550 RepID=UPI00029AC198|nr:MarR family transcriptional regulator [Dietzia alimentaria]
MDSELRLDHQVCFALYAASRASTSAYRQALSSVGLTYPQYLALLALWEEDGLTIRQLGEQLLLDSGTLSPLVARMESAGLVARSRSTDDGRSVRIHLTEAGRDLREQAESIQCSLLDRLTLPAEDLVRLRTLAQQFVASLDGAEQATA